ncbi:MAG: LysR family transcriptional regulator [Proteobacteria bacterium]|nr:LysR family transcriptional regulator [Pseudomonadota bacterium]
MELYELRALVGAADSGSFSRAAAILGSSRATLRKRVDALEKRVGQALLVRSPDGVEPTETGARFLPEARALLAQADALKCSLESKDDVHLGELHIVLPVGASPHTGTAIISTLRSRHPSMRIRTTVTVNPLLDFPVDADVVIHLGDRPRKGPFRVFGRPSGLGLYASGAYLEQHGTPTSLEDLADHDLLGWVRQGTDGRSWPLRGGGTVAIAPWFRCNEVHRLVLLVAAGQGISLLPMSMIVRPVAVGAELVPVLPRVVGGDESLYVLTPQATSQSARSRAVVRVMQEFAQRLN